MVSGTSASDDEPQTAMLLTQQEWDESVSSISGAPSESGASVKEETAYLMGRYEAFALLTRSPRMNKPQIELINRLALKTKDELEERGVGFKERA